MKNKRLSLPANDVVVFDTETTGFSPNTGCRIIEIGAVRLKEGVVVDKFQSLINPGQRIPKEISDYTKITNKMVADMPPPEKVMSEFHTFVNDNNLVAHNSSFDIRFLEAEYDRIGLKVCSNVGCSLMLARRVFQKAPNHKLETLMRYKNLNISGNFHRALADSEMAAAVWLAEIRQIEGFTKLVNIPFSTMLNISKTPKNKVFAKLKSLKT